MRSEDFDCWARRHAAVFGLTDEFAARTIGAWFQLFEAAGYTAEELSEATDWLALNNPPHYPADHLGAIQSCIRSVRAVEYRRQSDEMEHNRGTCDLCGSSGRVVVPHLRGVSGGLWVPVRIGGGNSFYTMAVLCRCAMGSWVAGRIHNGDHLPMGIDLYEARNPHWREQMAARRTEQAHAAALERKPHPEIDAVLDRLRRQAEVMV